MPCPLDLLSAVILNHKMEPEDSKGGKKHSPRSLNPARTQSLHYVPAAAMILQGENDKVILMRQTNSFSASTNGVGSFSLSEAEQVIGCWRATPTVKGKSSTSLKAGWGKKGRGQKCSDVTLSLRMTTRVVNGKEVFVVCGVTWSGGDGLTVQVWKP